MVERRLMDERTVYPYFEDVNLALVRLWRGRSGLDVLDVGCGYGRNGWEIQKLGNRVTGIESDATAIKVAAERLERVAPVNLLDLDAVRAQLAGRKFDVIIFADVLEHLPWPIGALRSYVEFLKDGGSVIVSLPNVALWSVRLALLFGRFQYTGSGVMDATHMRFFTRRSVREMFAAAALKPVATTYNPGIVRVLLPLIKKAAPQNPTALIDSRAYRTYVKLVHPVERAVASLAPGLLAFQIVTEARPA
jgi:2-polyprenyl-3-methyl-5-hydroxy-6-metoxy-1,4-benzoquinol methylase